MLRKDRNALEGMPLKLLIISVLIALTMPALYGSLNSFRSTSTEMLLREKVSTLCSMAEDCFNAGPGNVRTVEVELPVDGSIMIGGTNTAAMSIGYQLEGKVPVRTYLTDPCIRFITPDSGLILSGLKHNVQFRCELEGGAQVLRVTV